MLSVRSRQRSTASRHVLDPDRLEARVDAGQRHHREDRLQRCEQVEKAVAGAEDDRGPQHVSSNGAARRIASASALLRR